MQRVPENGAMDDPGEVESYDRLSSRHLGLVGGYAQTSWLPPRQRRFGLDNCTLVGDHSFPGQSLAGPMVVDWVRPDFGGRR